MNTTLIKIGVVICIGVAMQPEALVAVTWRISGTKGFYDKPHIHFEDSSI